MPVTHPLDTALPLAALPDLVRRLFDALDARFDPTSLAPETDTTAFASGGYAGTIEQSLWSSGGQELLITSKTGDNGATDSRAFAATFLANAEVRGLPGGVVLSFEGTSWGGTTVDQYTLTGQGAEAVDEALRALLAADSDPSDT